MRTNNSTGTDVAPNSSVETIDHEESVNLKRYFMPNATTAYFKGTGNEFASYKETTTWLGEDYIQTVVNNGGATVEKVYRITQNEIQLVLQQEVPDESITVFTEQELNQLKKIDIVLEVPLQEGKKVGNRQIVSMSTEIDTAYGHFKDVLVVEEIQDQSKTLYYYAPDYGLVRTEFYQGNELTISSELASIGKPYWENE